MLRSFDTAALLRALDAQQEGVALIDDEGRIQHASPALQQACGGTISPGSTLQECLGCRHPIPDAGQVCVAARRPDGSRWRAELSIEPLGALTLVRLRAPPRAQNPELLLSIRRFTHDFNNDLQTISIHTELLSRWAHISPSVQEDIAILQESTRRACKRVARMQATLLSSPSLDSEVTILVLEENPSVLRLTSRILSRAKWDLVEADSLDKALLVLQAEPEQPFVVLVSGRSAEQAQDRLAALHEAHSALRILLCLTSPPPPVRQWGALGIHAALQKPYTPLDLTETVEDLLVLSR